MPRKVEGPQSLVELFHRDGLGVVFLGLGSILATHEILSEYDGKWA